MNKVSVYTIPSCPYCTQAKNLLAQNDIPFEEIHINRNDQKSIDDLVAKSGMRTFPQIFFGDDLIGGFTQLRALHLAKDLKKVFKGTH